MKLIDKFDVVNDKSLYSGKTSVSNELYLRPIPSIDADGNPIKASQRYYVFRLLNFQTEERDSPFIVRYEHVYFKKDASGKVIDVSKICCPTTNWAQKKINEKVDSDYCPICKLSKKNHTEAWKNYKTTKQFDSVSLQISKDTKKHIAFYIPVMVISDPSNEKNNNRLKVLKISGVNGEDSGREAIATFNRIRAIIAGANQQNLIVFNGEEGANIAFLCEKQRKFSTDKNGNPIIDPKTGEQRSYMSTVISDVRLLTKRLHSYPNITEEAIERLNFDETYGAVATKDQLTAFMNENYLDTGASDSDFGEIDDSEFSAPSNEVQKSNEKQAQTVDAEYCEEAESDAGNESSDKPETTESDDEFGPSDIDEIDKDESPSDTISRITGGKVKVGESQKKVKMENKANLPPDSESLRQKSMTFDDDDLPF